MADEEIEGIIKYILQMPKQVSQAKLGRPGIQARPPGACLRITAPRQFIAGSDFVSSVLTSLESSTVPGTQETP